MANATTDRSEARPAPTLTYAALLIAQTVAATYLFLTIFPLFQEMVWHLGEAQDIPIWKQAGVVAGAVFLQGCYWTRYCRVTVRAPFHSVFLAHLLLFASRASFFFSGALFTTIFVRHVPELDALPPVEQAGVKIICLMTILFALFCYSLELERLGKAFEEPAPPRTA
jgi:hypothetical protein